MMSLPTKTAESMKVAKLKLLLSKHHLPISGKKVDLVTSIGHS